MQDRSEMLVPVELKYRERCGLWFRSKDEEEVLSRMCAQDGGISRTTATQARHCRAGGIG